MNALLWVTLGGISLTCGDVIFKFWLERHVPLLYVAGLALYLVGLVCLVESYKSENIAVASAIFVIINIVTLLVLSWFYFDEKLSALQVVGLALSIGSILLLELGK